MPIGLVNNDDFLAELNSLRPSQGKDTPVSIPAQETNEPNDADDQRPAVSTNLFPENKSYPVPTHLVTQPGPATQEVRVTQPGGKTAVIEDIPRRGRKEGDNNVPDSLRKLIAETALMDGRAAALQLAKDFGLSASSVSAYTNGATSTTTYNEPKSSIVQHVNVIKERAIKRASRTLNGALKAISQDKLDNTDAKDLAGIARDMTVVIKNLSPDSSGEGSDGTKTPQFVVFAPQFRDERSFESITINE